MHAFSRSDYEHMSTAKYFESLKTLIVEFDAGDWDPRVAIYNSRDWTPKELVESKVRLPGRPTGAQHSRKEHCSQYLSLTGALRFPHEAKPLQLAEEPKCIHSDVEIPLPNLRGRRRCISPSSSVLS